MVTKNSDIQWDTESEKMSIITQNPKVNYIQIKMNKISPLSKM